MFRWLVAHASGFLGSCAAVAAAVAMAACSSGDDANGDARSGSASGSDSVAADVRAAYESFQEAAARRQYGKVCQALTDQARAQSTGSRPSEATCPRYAELLLSDGLRKPPKLVEVQARGDRATVVLRAGDGPPYGVPFVKQADGWKVNQSLSGE